MPETAQTDTGTAKRGKAAAAKTAGAPVKTRRTRAEVLAARDKAIEKSKQIIGRPRDYTPELGAYIVQRIRNGAHYSDLVEEGLVTNYNNLALWKEQDPSFKDAVERAQEERAELWADQLIEIADNPLLDPNDRRIRVETRWKVIGSLLYRRYGVKQQVDINQRIDVGSTAAEVLMRLTEQAKQAKLSAPNIIDVTPTDTRKV